MCHTPGPHFIVYINPITTFIVYIITFYSIFYAFDAILFYCTLSEMTRIKMINQLKPESCHDVNSAVAGSWLR